MKQGIVEGASDQSGIAAKTALEDVLREGARQMLQAAIENEVAEYVDRYGEERDGRGHRLVVRNGHQLERALVTGIGPVKVRQPRVHDRRAGEAFTSQILPPFMRRVPSVDALIPCLYLKGISTGDFGEALSAILGPQAAGLSATNIVRLKEGWKQDYDRWRQRDLSGKHYVYLWVDGVHFNVRLEDERSCILVVIGATAEGRKELIAVQDGHRESKLSWMDVLRDMKARGLKAVPALATGDGALGFWAAAAEEFPTMRAQRCWVHKTANVLDKMPKGVQGQAKTRIHDIYLAATRDQALKAFDEFLRLYDAKYADACECLRKDKDVLLSFYDFPAEHWIHLRTTNPIESLFATVRLRTARTKGCGSRSATLMMVYKLAEQAEKHWRRLNKHEYIALLIQGARFVDGELQKAA
jgi:putative transposase